MNAGVSTVPRAKSRRPRRVAPSCASSVKRIRATAEFKRILREGRLALIIGLVCLGTCLLAAHALIPRNAGDWGGYVRESLTIAGWVSMWRPMEMYLYDWWPVLRRERVFRKLAAMPVEVVGAPPVAKVANHLLVKA